MRSHAHTFSVPKRDLLSLHGYGRGVLPGPGEALHWGVRRILHGVRRRGWRWAAVRLAEQAETPRAAGCRSGIRQGRFKQATGRAGVRGKRGCVPGPGSGSRGSCFAYPAALFGLEKASGMPTHAFHNATRRFSAPTASNCRANARVADERGPRAAAPKRSLAHAMRRHVRRHVAQRTGHMSAGKWTRCIATLAGPVVVSCRSPPSLRLPRTPTPCTGINKRPPHCSTSAQGRAAGATATAGERARLEQQRGQVNTVATKAVVVRSRPRLPR